MKINWPYIRENRKIIGQFIFSVFFIGTAIWFVKHEQGELVAVKNQLRTADWTWVTLGILLALGYILLQSLMYIGSFASIKAGITLTDGLILFLKRNFISVFLPAGGITSLAFFTGPLEKKGIKDSQIHFASAIYGFVGILTVAMIAIPAFLYAVVFKSKGDSDWYALLALIVLILTLIWMYISLKQKGKVYLLLVKYIPTTEKYLNDVTGQQFQTRYLVWTVVFSLLIEIVGIAHVYTAMLALHYQPSISAALMAYVVSVIFLVISPFLRGLGAVELSMGFVLGRFGFDPTGAIAVTLLYRFFEFWGPLVISACSFLLKINKLLLRILPAFLLLVLGIINIISVLTPAFKDRLTYLKNFVPTEAIHASNYLVLITGLFLLVTAAFMLKGLRSAWVFAIVLSIFSFIGHLSKAIDFEEASLALVVLIVLIVTRKEYYVKNNPRLQSIGLQTSILSMIAVLLYGIIGFYFLDKKNFGIDFNLIQSIRFTLANYFLVGSEALKPIGSFANHFINSLKISGAISFGFLIYTLVRPFIHLKNTTDQEISKAKQLCTLYGNSSLDYFKTYWDKLIFFSSDKESFIAYKIAGNFAVVLENPVSEHREAMVNCTKEFTVYCKENGIKNIYYRVPEKSLGIYQALGCKHLFLGQSGVVDLTDFKLDGPSKKSLRNAYRKISDKAFISKVYLPPIKEGVLQKIKLVSDEWLLETHRSEIIFSQGMFQWEEVRQQTIITVENEEKKIFAFLNIIPDYATGEATYDLLRKTKDAPNGVLDFLLLDLFTHLKNQGYNTVNLGLAPMSGLTVANTLSEKSMKYAYERINSFSHYKGLRDFKDKFSPVWENEYLIYTQDYDLLQAPAVLAKVIKI